jgi:hypothetical protein
MSSSAVTDQVYQITLKVQGYQAEPPIRSCTLG